MFFLIYLLDKCKAYGKPAVAYHTYIGKVCKKHLKWAQEQFCKTEKQITEPEYYI